MTHGTPRIDHVLRLQQSLIATGFDAVIGGSGLLVSLGLSETAKDWDVVVDADPTDVRAVLTQLGFAFVRHEPAGIHRTAALFRVDAADHEIDVMVRFALADGDATVPIPARSGAVWRGLVMADPRDWAIAYRLMGRSSKADALRDFLARGFESARGLSRRS